MRRFKRMNTIIQYNLWLKSRVHSSLVVVLWELKLKSSKDIPSPPELRKMKVSLSLIIREKN